MICHDYKLNFEDAWNDQPENMFLLRYDDKTGHTEYCSVPEEDKKYNWQKRYVYYDGNYEKRSHDILQYKIYRELKWSELIALTKTWNNDSIVLKSDIRDAYSNYGHIYNLFKIYITQPLIYNKTTRSYDKPEGMYTVRGWLCSSDDGGFGCWSNPLSLDEAKRIKNRLKNYINALQKDFYSLDFKKFVESENMIFDN